MTRVLEDEFFPLLESAFCAKPTPATEVARFLQNQQSASPLTRQIVGSLSEKLLEPFMAYSEELSVSESPAL